MIKSLKYFLLRRGLKYTAPFYRSKEAALVERFKGEIKHPLVFIVGAPRSGSTILYQSITNQLKCLYFDNFITLNRDNLFLGFKRDYKLFNDKPHNNFHSQLGETFGLHAPSESGYLWYRWFPEEPDYIHSKDISDDKKQEMRFLFSAIMNYHNKPLIIKNLKMGMRIRVLKDIFPDAKFIFIKRKPLYNAQSIYQARKKTGAANKWWSVKPANYSELLNKSLMHQSVAQVYFIQKQISEDLRKYYPDNYLQVDYDMMNEWTDLFNKICNFIGYGKKREAFEGIPFNRSDSVKLNAKEFEELKQLVNSYDWKTKYNEQS